ncbi:hypothetical protein ACWCO0_10295 [Streptomyces tubercidicus]|uniref:Ig-like domain-containing protein n=1 Tax=Streptomyces tubercidicus TaxID=47759 RepID=A0A640USQ1_9ACTN|nr:hypothetical protein [Streptomyces tubercidicus]WAU13247.1 hypothetical protein STRTU_003708 [Streptomyces tubercidicus]GFE38819.1 hypothetical protein Stube_34920 [Streptomyces tubercidicus]
MSRTKLLVLATAPALAIGLASPALAVNATDHPRVVTAESPVRFIGANQTETVTVTCPRGTFALSGGWSVSSASIDVTGNRAAGDRRWQIRFQNESNQSGRVQAFARCAY